MTVLNFPSSPALNQTYSANGVIYTWNGTYWEANNATNLDSRYVLASGDQMSGDLELPGGGGATAALQSQEIDALIAAGDTTNNLWEKDAGALKPKVSTDNVDIGDGKIELNAADGSASFAGNVLSGQSYDNVYLKAGKGDGTDASELTISARPGPGINNNVLTINTYPDSGTNKTQVFAVTYAGSASFAGRVTAEESIIGQRPDGNTIVSSKPAGGTGDHFTGIVDGVDVFNVASDGSASFAKSVLVGNSGTNTGEVLISGAANEALKISNGSVYTTQIKWDGSASFAGDVTIFDGLPSGTRTSSALLFAPTGTNIGSSIRADVSVNNDVSSLVFSTCAPNQTRKDVLTLDAQGSASFAGDVFAEKQFRTQNNYGVADNAVSGVVVEGSDGTANAKIAYDGSAEFAGTVTSANSFAIQLEADDDTKYTATTDSEGNETRVYNGAVLDVEEELQLLRARATQQDKTIAMMTTALKSLGIDTAAFPAPEEEPKERKRKTKK